MTQVESPVRAPESPDLLTRVDTTQRLRKRRRITVGDVIIRIVLTIFALLMIAPLFWMIVQAFTQTAYAFQRPPTWLPVNFTLDNFRRVFEIMPFGQQFMNSLILAVGTTVGSLLFSILAAYGISRIEYRGSRVTLLLMLSAMMVPAQLTIIPIFVIMRHLGLVNTLWSILIPGLVNVFQIFFLSQYFRTIPREIDEAAKLDGAGHLWILFRMLVPLAGPALASLAILAFQASWNNYFAPLIFLSSPENMTLPLGLVVLQQGFGAAPATVVFAAITMVVVPALVLFIAFQKHFVASIATTGSKG